MMMTVRELRMKLGTLAPYHRVIVQAPVGGDVQIVVLDRDDRLVTTFKMETE